MSGEEQRPQDDQWRPYKEGFQRDAGALELRVVPLGIDEPPTSWLWEVVTAGTDEGEDAEGTAGSSERAKVLADGVAQLLNNPAVTSECTRP